MDCLTKIVSELLKDLSQMRLEIGILQGIEYRDTEV